MWLQQQVKDQGCTEKVQLQFLRRMFPDLPREVVLGVMCPPEYDAKKVPFNRRVRRQLFDKGVPTLLNLFSGTRRWKESPGLVLGVELKEGLISWPVTRLA